MNYIELAAELNGREYRNEITDDEHKEAKLNGLVVVFGGSDDLIYFSGAVSDELGAYEGGVFYFTKDGLVTNECEDDSCPYYKKLKKGVATIKAKWSVDGYSWIYETGIPHATFEVMEGDEKYCRGIVFALAEVA